MQNKNLDNVKVDEILNEQVMKNWEINEELNDKYVEPDKNDIIISKELGEMRRIDIKKYKQLIHENKYMKGYCTYYLQSEGKKIIVVDLDGKNIHRHLKRYTDKKIGLMLTGYEKIYLFMTGLLTFLTIIVGYYTYSSYSTFTEINQKMNNAVSTFNNNNYFKEEEIMTNTFVNKKIVERFSSTEELQNYILNERNKRNAMLQAEKIGTGN